MDMHSKNQYLKELQQKYRMRRSRKKSPLFWMSITAIPVVLIIVGSNPTQPSRKPVLLNT